MATVRVESIADHLDLVGVVARWHWDEWGHTDPGGSLRSWTAGLRQRANRDRIPATYVALDGEELLGSVTLVAHDMSTRLDLSPWVAGVYVKPEWRGQGVGSALVRHATECAARLGVKQLYLYTASAQGFYEKLGWQHIAEDYYEGRRVSIMQIDPASLPTQQ